MRKWTVVAPVAAVFALASMLVPSMASARPNESETLRFYSDATYSTPVGTTFTSCSGAVYRTGVETPYYEVVTSRPCSGCCVGPEPTPWQFGVGPGSTLGRFH